MQRRVPGRPAITAAARKLVDLEKVSAGEVITADLVRVQLGNVYTRFVALDFLKEHKQSHVFSVQHHFAETLPRSILTHIATELICERIADEGLVVVRREKDPVFLFRHSQDGCIYALPFFVPQLDTVLFFWEHLRRRTAYFYTNLAVVVVGFVADVIDHPRPIVDDLHVGHDFGIIQDSLAVGIDYYNGKIGFGKLLAKCRNNAYEGQQ